MTEDGGVHPACRNASNPFHLCSNYCFQLISEAKKGLNTTGGITEVKDDGIGCSPTTPLDEGDQSGNLVDQSTLLARNDDEDNEAGNLPNLSKRQKRKQEEAIETLQNAIVQDKKTMEPPEKMAQEKQPAPVVRDGITEVKDDGIGRSPTTPLYEGDQSRNLVGQSTLLASNDDEDNEARNRPNLSKRQKRKLRIQKEAMEAFQNAMVQEKKIMELPEEVAQEKQPAPVGRDGENFIKDFLVAFPPLTYHGDKGGEEIYAPPIPVKEDVYAKINPEDVSKVGAYPDHVVLSIANERDKLKLQLLRIANERDKLKTQLLRIANERDKLKTQLQQVMEEDTKLKMMYQNQHRQAELWHAKYNALAHMPASHGQKSGVERS